MSECIDHELKNLMTRIKEVRYTDLDEERKLCRELLKRTEKSGNSFGQMFAHAFLGDYHIAMNEVDIAGKHLLKALELCKNQDAGEHDDVRFRIYSLLGIYYNHKGDEQSSIQYYLYADDLALRMGDTLSECMVLNNIAFTFQRHNGMDKALEFYQKAYEMQKPLEHSPIAPLLISNLTEVLITQGKLEEAWAYLDQYKHMDADEQEKERMFRNNMCLYYAKQGDKTQCLKWMEQILSNLDEVDANQMMAFENYASFFDAMVQIGHKQYAKKFLDLMEQSCSMGGIDQPKILEAKRIEYCLCFEDEKKQDAAYERFYIKMQEFKKETNRTISNAMKTMIYLDELRRSDAQLKDEQDDLRRASTVDELTGIFNRRYFDSLIRRYEQEADAGRIAVIMLDVDYFKEYNDFYKHFEGDRVLKEVAGCLREYAVEGITPCRYGGDEFVCICDDMDKNAVEGYIASVRECLEKKAIPHEKSHCSNRVTLSIGFALAADKEEAELVLESADQALYKSKEAGRNTVRGGQVNDDA